MMFELNEKFQTEMVGENSFDSLIQELEELKAAVESAVAQAELGERVPKINEIKKEPMDFQIDEVIAEYNRRGGLLQPEPANNDGFVSTDDELRNILNRIEKSVSEAINSSESSSNPAQETGNDSTLFH